MRAKRDKKPVYERAKEDAFRLLSYRQRSKQELAQRLKSKGYSERAVKRVIDRLEELSFIDDLRLAEELVRQALERKPRSRSALLFEMRRLGIDEEVIWQVTEELTEETEIEMACRVVEKVLGASADDGAYPPSSVKRAVSTLRGRGFSYEVIKEALNRWGVKGEIL